MSLEKQALTNYYNFAVKGAKPDKCPYCNDVIKGWARTKCVDCSRIFCRSHMEPSLGQNKRCPFCREKRQSFLKKDAVTASLRVAENLRAEFELGAAQDLEDKIFASIFGNKELIKFAQVEENKEEATETEPVETPAPEQPQQPEKPQPEQPQPEQQIDPNQALNELVSSLSNDILSTLSEDSVVTPDVLNDTFQSMLSQLSNFTPSTRTSASTDLRSLFTDTSAEGIGLGKLITYFDKKGNLITEAYKGGLQDAEMAGGVVPPAFAEKFNELSNFVRQLPDVNDPNFMQKAAQAAQSINGITEMLYRMKMSPSVLEQNLKLQGGDPTIVDMLIDMSKGSKVAPERRRQEPTPINPTQGFNFMGPGR